jgi:hypothetical protein
MTAEEFSGIVSLNVIDVLRHQQRAAVEKQGDE